MGVSNADLGRLLGRQMRRDYDASLPEGPLPDDLGRLIEKLQAATRSRCADEKR
jgi:hypothetical protein